MAMGTIPTVKSILFSLYQHFRTLPLFDAIHDVVLAVRGVIRALFSRSKDAKVLSDARMAVCEKCEFFDETWQTCGTPGETIGGPLDMPPLKVGCWCYLPLASRDSEKDCWARMDDIVREDGSMVGWPDELRPSLKL